ncbi:MAG: hypothetical protein ACRDHK_03390 [Actinomycetota bacterium]
MRRVPALLLLFALVIPSGTARVQDLMITGASPDDLRALIVATWDRFVEAFPARRSCLAPVSVQGAWELDDRGSYDPVRRLVMVRIPGTAPNLRDSLVHEFAHHMEFTCPEHHDVRVPFLVAQALPPSASWFEGRSWEITPSEQFAEAVVRVVLGPPAHPTVLILPRSVALLRAWARRDLRHGP